jgi:hypothetical protein
MRAGRRADRGQAVFVLLGVVAVAAVLLVGLASFGARLVRAERAQLAADAAALAGVSGGRDRAAALAARNGATLVEYVDDGSSVTVTVAVGAERARAWATDGR